MTPVDVVQIGRNEGARLVAALSAVRGQAREIVYVDSGSTDGSRAEARAAGAQVVELDLAAPFTAARARNAGFDALTSPRFVLFIDGDCVLQPGFIEAARANLQANPRLALVTGWRAEIHPDASIYNALCDWEWHRPAGPIRACGGDMLVRAEAWRDVGGMNPSVIAAEDDEFCTRLRKAGWELERIPARMTVHDAAMSRFDQWWVRAVRTGHGFAQVGQLHPDYFVTERRRVLIFGLVLPILFVAGLFVMPWVSGVVLLLYAVSHLRAVRALIRDGVSPARARALAPLLTLSKFPNLIGMMRYHARRLSGADMSIIEYK